MLADAELYSQYHSMQVKDGNKLLDRVLPEMCFGEDDVIMDIGCGSGDNTTGLLLPRISKLKKLVGIDVIPEMIEYARTYLADEKTEYHVADIEDSSSVKQWAGSISKAFSVHCFHWLKNQRRAFEVLFDLLKPGGEAALLFILQASIWNSYPTLVNDVKWNKYLKDVEKHVPDSHYLNLREEHYRDMLKDLGFEVLLCQEEDRSYSYKDDTEARAAWGSRSALTSHIPKELRDEFLDELFNEYLKVSPRSSEGLPTLYPTVLTVYIRKPF